MKRDLEQLQTTTFDLAVAGGGIHGATIAALAAACGLSTLLLERGDFCGATSANSLKILHGGLRYLQHLDLPRIRDSIVSRRWMMANFPDLVEPLPCVMPTSGRGLRSRGVMALGLLLNDLFSCTRNRGLPLGRRLGRGRVISAAACARIIPGFDPSLHTGGAVWHDALALNPERIVLDLVNRLSELGGAAANYVSLRSISDEDGCKLLECEDEEGNGPFQVRARWLVNATGPGCAQFAELQRELAPICSGWSRAVNLVVKPRLFSGYGVGLEGQSSFVDQDAVIQKGKRLFFFVPWRGKTMIGTVYSPHPDPSQAPEISREELCAILEEVNQINPQARLRYQDISLIHIGLMPSIPLENGGPFDVQLDKKAALVDHGALGGSPRVLTVKTVKYTTAFSLASQVMAHLAGQGLALEPQWRARIRSLMPEAAGPGAVKELPGYLLRRYGRQAARVYPYLAPDRGGQVVKPPVEEPEPVDQGEIRYAVAEEMALHLEDILFRRTDLATAAMVPQPLLEQCAATMAELLGWDEEQQAAELRRVMDRLRPLDPGSS
ncbi:glycerol-3-phosphate dehydrogenase/oxidase [Desulfogranum mediterraneum]|uniref:glycerol-3-phosphate dehydrogenase/oxidase n=1 Tax=Desulfogranum mediterraneum TaxID=160661 RepID=UPI000405AF85|nr:FAD-dependent oxidoreductase [Desulfogranum mediterraneum]